MGVASYVGGCGFICGWVGLPACEKAWVSVSACEGHVWVGVSACEGHVWVGVSACKGVCEIR